MSAVFVASTLLACAHEAPSSTSAQHAPSVCRGLLFDLPDGTLTIEGMAGGMTGRVTVLYADGLVTDGGDAIGRLDETGCFHDLQGSLIARWVADGRLLVPDDPGPVQLRLRQGRLEYIELDKLDATWPVEGTRLLRNDTCVATIAISGGGAPELALRVLLLPDLERTARERPIE